MPYIKHTDRFQLIYQEREADTPGELNFMITRLLSHYLDSKGKSYQTINDVMGALEGAKLEFYRRVAAPYEDTKIKENGDVY